MDACVSYTPRNSWEIIPSEALRTIFSFLTLNERCSASATCTKWRELFFLPIFWRHLTLILSTRKDGARCEFLSKIATYVQYLEITWPHPWIYDQQRHWKQLTTVRPVDKDITNNLVVFFQALSHSTCLRSLILKFENSGSRDEQFCGFVTRCISKILTDSKRLRVLSFGYNPKITWKKAMSTKPIGLVNVEELHIAWPQSSSDDENSGSQNAQISKDEFHSFSSLNRLHTLGINWTDITPALLESLCERDNNAVAMKKLMIYLQKQENGRTETHPSEAQWQRFTSRNPDVKISLVIMNALTDVCPQLQNIASNVYMLKFLECDEIQEEPFSNLMDWFQYSLQAHVYVSTKRPIELSNGENLYQHARICQNLKYISILGYYIEDSALLIATGSFPKLEQVIVTKAHILTFAVATMFMVPISGAKYTHFQAEMSDCLQKPWRALTSFPFEQLYFTEGKDDDFYLTGKLNTEQNSAEMSSTNRVS